MKTKIVCFFVCLFFIEAMKQISFKYIFIKIKIQKQMIKDKRARESIMHAFYLCFFLSKFINYCLN
jgi:hypothetical protein